jgi:hypothetical protein
MNSGSEITVNETPCAMLIAMIPGPGRRREYSIYQYRMVFRNPEPETDGCLALWHVSGGRMTYQVALQRDIQGQLCWHCTCADHVYRHELSESHCCKHVRALREFMPPMQSATVAWAA